MDLWLKFYPKDWNGDHQLRMCSLAARGLWASFLEPMHMAVPYGHLLINGKPPTVTDLAVIASCRPREVEYCLKELVDRGVASVRDDGVVYSRRMVRDAERLTKRRSNGAKGGHPKLVGGKPEVNHPLNQLPNHVVLPMASSDLASGISASPDHKNEARLDFAWSRFLDTYPQHRRQEGALAEHGFVAACLEVGVDEVFTRLEAHKRSAQWRKGLAPKIANYFGPEKLWKQVLPEQESGDQKQRHSQFLGHNKGAEIADV